MCLTTHDRIDCARINQEIIKLNYRRALPIVHAVSATDYRPYLEDVLVSCEARPLKAGALNLLQRSIAAATSAFDADYLVHLEGDTWLMDEDVIQRYIAKMEADERLVLCTCSWNEEGLVTRSGWRPRLARRLGFDYRLDGLESLGTQFFIIRNRRAVIDLIMGLAPPAQGQSLEQAFCRDFMRTYSGRNVLRMREREPVHPDKRYQCAELSLHCQHWPARGTTDDPRRRDHPLYVSDTAPGKREVLQWYPGIRKGQYLQKLLGATEFDYYNPGAKRY